jgi:cyanophycin synthetase
VLETRGLSPSDDLLDAWRERVHSRSALLGWPEPMLCARRHARGVALALSAPLDQLFAATEVNEWAWLSALHASARLDSHGDAFHAPGHPAAWDENAAWETLSRLAAGERRPALLELAVAADAHRVGLLLDDDEISLGGGDGSVTWPLASMPAPAALEWSALHEIPIALVTGSNGKTTTVRLLAAMLRAAGKSSAWSCTDGLFANGEKLRGGDYSGPAGARAVLRHPQAQAAVLETARGGLLRRGLALSRADVAIVTNISVDHFGEYGIHDLDGLADVKLIVAHAVREPGSLLVLNADDALLRRRTPPAHHATGWFALDDAHALLLETRAQGGATCGVDRGRLKLHWQGATHDLGAIDAMPLAFGGRALYNVSNIAAASLGAAALGIPPDVIAAVLADFGRRHADNPGRLQHWDRDGVQVFVDYAHNTDGLRGLLQVAVAQRATGGRLGLLLGQAGNREDAEIRELAAVAAEFTPDRVVLKDLAQMLRGRAAGDVPALLRAALLAHDVAASVLQTNLDEEAAARQLLDWARPGDVVVLPLHSGVARDTIVALLDAGAASGE